MKKIIPLVLIAACFSGCNSKRTAITKEHRGNPASGIADGGFVNQRTGQLQQMGGPFKDRAAAEQKAIEEANSHFGGPGGDTVTTTWSNSKAQAQEEFTDKLDDLARQKKAQ
jgi:hypothetical protein